MPSKQINKPFLLDTWAWVWIALGHERATFNVRKKLQAFTPWLLSEISIWELSILVKNKKIKLDRPVEHWVQDNLMRAPHLHLASIKPEIAILSSNLKNFKSLNPTNSLIVATAICHNAMLVTPDKKKIAYGRSGNLSILSI